MAKRRPLLRSDLERLAKANPIVGERLKAGYYDERLKAPSSSPPPPTVRVKAPPAGPKRRATKTKPPAAPAPTPTPRPSDDRPPGFFRSLARGIFDV